MPEPGLPEPEIKVIGPYRIERILGRGGMGTVYLGIHAKSSESVAVKLIASEMAEHQRFRRRFDAEIQTLLRLKHPSIVKLIGVGEEKGLLFYSMEYVEGENLHQRLKRQKRIAWPVVLDWAIDIASALKHAHDFGIIHRDIKPANLLLDLSDKIKLTDFGIAKLFGAQESTVPGSVIGTADFMPPEQAEGQAVTPRSDLYALGAICYACLAGRPPFTGTNVPEILFNVRYGVYAPIGSLAPDTPEEFARLIDELLARSVSNRPPTAYLALSRLQALRAGLSRKAVSPPLNEQVIAPKLPAVEPSPSDHTSIDVGAHPSVAELAAPINATRILPEDMAELPAPTRAPATRLGPGAASRSKETTQDINAVSQESRVTPEEVPSGLADVRKTNFTEITDRDRIETTIFNDLKTPDTSSRWGEVLLIIAALAASVLGIFYFTRPVDPQKLFAPIEEAWDNRDEVRLLELDEEIESFRKLHADFTDIDIVEQAASEVDYLKKLRVLQRRISGVPETNDTILMIDPLRFIVRLHQEDSKAALELLNAYLDSYKPSLLSDSQRPWLDVASRLKRDWQLDLETAKHGNSIESLEKYIQKLQTELSPKEQQTHLMALRKLYKNLPWAQPLIEQLDRELNPTP
jgi:serine/threonine-protein kinase